MVQLEKFPLLRVFKVIVLFPTIALVVDEEHDPPNVIVPAMVDAKV